MARRRACLILAALILIAGVLCSGIGTAGAIKPDWARGRGKPTTTTTVGVTTTTVAPTTTTTVAPTTTTTVASPPGSAYTVDSSGTIHAPNGAVFVPNGANVGLPCSFEGNGWANGHSGDALAWGWTAVRLTLVTQASQWWGCGVDMAVEAQKVINEYTAAGIVVQVETHDLSMQGSTADADIVLNWISRVATTNNGNPLVWWNCFNEPPADGTAYVSLQKRCVDTVRGAGATSPVVLDATWDANDGNWDAPPTLAQSCPTFRAYDPRHAIVQSLHNYGGWTDASALSSYIDQVRAGGCAMEVGEFGVGGTTAGTPQQNRDAANATFAAAPPKGVGLLIWHGTHNDGYSVKADGGPFWETCPGCNLSSVGQQMWGVTHG